MSKKKQRKEQGKYSNKKIIDGNEVFDSTKEHDRYLELKAWEEEGLISNLQRQVEFLLIPTQYEFVEQYSKKTGKRIKDKKVAVERKCSYYADFVYTDKNGNTICEDTKGMKTTDYIIKRKLMLYINGLKIHEL